MVVVCVIWLNIRLYCHLYSSWLLWMLLELIVVVVRLLLLHSIHIDWISRLNCTISLPHSALSFLSWFFCDHLNRCVFSLGDSLLLLQNFAHFFLWHRPVKIVHSDYHVLAVYIDLYFSCSVYITAPLLKSFLLLSAQAWIDLIVSLVRITVVVIVIGILLLPHVIWCASLLDLHRHDHFAAHRCLFLGCRLVIVFVALHQNILVYVVVHLIPELIVLDPGISHFIVVSPLFDL